MDYSTASGSSITITVPYVFDGNPLTLTDFKYTVYDAAGTVLFGPVSDPSFNPANSESAITIDGSYNVTTERYDVRSLECKLITATGTFTVTEFYEIKGDVLKLIPFTDSFMTFAESQLVRKRISEQMAYYDSLEDESKVLVLENAFDRLMDLQYNLGPTYDKQCIHSLSQLTLEQFEALDPKLLEALKKAQIAEANHIVETNPVKDKIRMGIISETIGESSMFFKQNWTDSKAYYPGISDEAYPYLSKYLYKENLNAQVWKLRRS